LLVALLVRLPGLAEPIAGAHAWRQADTAAMARNFVRCGMHILEPQIDWGGASAGIVESEFPLYSYLVALIWKAGGVHEATARLLSIVCSLLGVLALYVLVKRLSDARLALVAAGFQALLPLNVYYGRAILPEAAYVPLSIAGLYWFDRHLETGSWKSLLGSVAAITLACLLKITNLFLAVPLAYLAVDRRRRLPWLEWRLWLYPAIVLAATLLWYHHANWIGRTSRLSFGVWNYGIDKWGRWPLLGQWRFWNGVIFQKIVERHLTWPGLGLLAVGVATGPRFRADRLCGWWLAGGAVFLLVVSGGNLVHEYYQLSIVPPLAYFLAKGTVAPWRRPRAPALRIATVLLLAGVVGFSAHRCWEYYRVYRRETVADQLALAALLQERTGPADRIVLLDEYDPTIFWLADRRGWHVPPEELVPPRLDEFTRDGAVCVAGLRVAARDDRQRAMLARFLESAGPRVTATERLFFVRLTNGG
jgi:hypothetical protein